LYFCQRVHGWGYPQNVSGTVSSLQELSEPKSAPYQRRPLHAHQALGFHFPFGFEHHKRPIIPLPYPLLAILVLVPNHMVKHKYYLIWFYFNLSSVKIVIKPYYLSFGTCNDCKKIEAYVAQQSTY